MNLYKEYADKAVKDIADYEDRRALEMVGRTLKEAQTIPNRTIFYVLPSWKYPIKRLRKLRALRKLRKFHD